MIRWMLILTIFCVACQSGQIPCPEVQESKLKKTRINKRLRFAERVSMNMPQHREMKRAERLSAERSNNERSDNTERSTAQKYQLNREETRPALEHVDVEEWDCPKPGSKKNMPRAVKENIRKNTKKMRDYVRSRQASDTVQAISSGRPY